MLSESQVAVSELTLLSKIGETFESLPMEVRAVLKVVRPDEVATASGVILRLKKVPNQLVVEATRKLKRPQPPKVFDEGKQREITNENDPAYLDAISEHMSERAQAITLIYFAFGTELKHRPDDVLGPDDDWDVPYRDIVQDLELPEKGTRRRYVAWLRMYVLEDEEKDALLNILYGNYGIVTEEQVAQAMETFRRDQAGPADNGNGAASKPVQDGN